MLIHIESNSMLDLLHTAVQVRLAAIQIKMSLSSTFNEQAQNLVSTDIILLDELLAKIDYCIKFNIAFRSESELTANMLCDSLKTLIHYDYLDVAANHQKIKSYFRAEKCKELLNGIKSRLQ